MRGRKGAAFPSHMHKIQPLTEYLQEQSLRFYTDKELKINLMLTELLSYLQMRFEKFDKLQPNSTTVDFVEPLLSIFEERLYKQAKSNFVQHIILFIIQQVEKPGLPKAARTASKMYMERILSHLILRAFPTQEAQDLNHLTSRMQAINYLGSLQAQNVAPLPESTFMKCLGLTLDYYHKNKRQCPTFNHCFVGNLALMFAARAVEIKLHNPSLYEQVVSILFAKKWVSLEYASPSTLELLLGALSSGHLGRREREMAIKVGKLIEE